MNLKGEWIRSNDFVTVNNVNSVVSELETDGKKARVQRSMFGSTFSRFFYAKLKIKKIAAAAVIGISSFTSS